MKRLSVLKQGAILAVACMLVFATPLRAAAQIITGQSDTITPEIEDLARGLLHDPVKIYEYVLNQIEYEHYFGAKRGAHLTMVERTGNEFDQCALLVALLRASGYRADYQFGLVRMPLSSTNGYDLVNWLGVRTNGVTVSNALGNGVSELRQRHGNVFRFNTNNLLGEIEDLHTKKMQFSYHADKRLDYLQDAYGRRLVFNYPAGDTNRMSSVAESLSAGVTNRSVTFTYTGTNLTTFADPEGKQTHYFYDPTNRLLQVTDHDNRTITTNVYDAQSRVIQQRSEGDPDKLWQLFYTGFCNREVNPLLGTNCHFFDERGRSLGVEDANGNRTRLVYDGQDHVIEQVTPKGDTNVFIYDGTMATTTCSSPATRSATASPTSMTPSTGSSPASIRAGSSIASSTTRSIKSSAPPTPPAITSITSTTEAAMASASRIGSRTKRARSRSSNTTRRAS